jgi:hypothetical protein
VANKNIRAGGQNEHDAAPFQQAPVENKSSLAVPSLLLPLPALPATYCGSEAIEHFHSSVCE